MVRRRHFIGFFVLIQLSLAFQGPLQSSITRMMRIQQKGRVPKAFGLPPSRGFASIPTAVDRLAPEQLKKLSVNQNFPTGPERNSRIEKKPTADMEISFLGTASCSPSTSRGVSCTVFRYNERNWLFDCGEGCQRQLQWSPIKVSKISKIFITHLHGDHSFGIPGVLCMIGQSISDTALNGVSEKKDETEIMDIYGPEGIRSFVRSALQLSYSKIARAFRIHELKNAGISRYDIGISTTRMAEFGEVELGRDIYPNDKGCYDLFSGDDGLSVSAAPLSHTMPCVGYVIREEMKLGNLKTKFLDPIIKRNQEKLCLKFNYSDARIIYRQLKQLGDNESFAFPDGTVVNGADVKTVPSKGGRKVVVLGDTADSSAIAELASAADVLVHEATNSWVDRERAQVPAFDVHEKTVTNHGHSTADMAGRFARKIGARQLVLTHFSPRYYGDDSPFSMKLMWDIEDRARVAAGLWGKNDVIAAWDFLQLQVHNSKGNDNDSEKE